MTDEQTPTEDPTPADGVPTPSMWRKRLGLAGLASLGGFVAWIFGRRDRSPDA
jgi:hypothetical protein